MLGAAGYQVTSVASGAEALALRDAGRMFDAIVSDIDMPEMDGLTLARTIRAGGPWAELPLIALTARAEPRDIEVGREAGFSDYVTKSRREDLTEALRACLAEPALV
jgi:two-component system chemotaxis sensor kinase CheA